MHGFVQVNSYRFLCPEEGNSHEGGEGGTECMESGKEERVCPACGVQYCTFRFPFCTAHSSGVMFLQNPPAAKLSSSEEEGGGRTLTSTRRAGLETNEDGLEALGRR